MTGFCSRRDIVATDNNGLPCGTPEKNSVKVKICPVADNYFKGLLVGKHVVIKTEGGEKIDCVSESYSHAQLFVDGVVVRGISSGRIGL